MSALTNRELLEESAELLRGLSDTLAEFEPMLALMRAARGNGGPSYVKAAGMRRAMRRSVTNGDHA